MTEWIEETLHADFRFKMKVERVLFEGRSENQHVAVVENDTFGRTLYLDGVLQTSERDEFIYHEMLTHVPILGHGEVRDLLIIGGGDGGMLEEALKHRTIERATMVEIDPSVVEMCRQHLPSISKGAFDDARTDLVFADGVDFVETTDKRFDVAIIDSTDPIGPGEALFTDDFYRSAKGVLKEGGILVTQNGVPFVQGDELAQTMRALDGLFADAACYLATVPGYVGGPMAFGWGSDALQHRRVSIDMLERRFAAADLDVRYYRPDVHVGAFALPGYILELIGGR
ncbi:MAG: polyamine aminopropyltransferase [Alphaproteobacteria bacterium]|nr:polyamine aminopropyltransferase [Alphaproteobacteria bacterium]